MVPKVVSSVTLTYCRTIESLKLKFASIVIHKYEFQLKDISSLRLAMAISQCPLLNITSPRNKSIFQKTEENSFQATE